MAPPGWMRQAPHTQHVQPPPRAVPFPVVPSSVDNSTIQMLAMSQTWVSCFFSLVDSIMKSWCFCLLGIAWICSLLFQPLPGRFISSVSCLTPLWSFLHSSASVNCPSFIQELFVKIWLHHITSQHHGSTHSLLQSFLAGYIILSSFCTC